MYKMNQIITTFGDMITNSRFGFGRMEDGGCDGWPSLPAAYQQHTEQASNIYASVGILYGRYLDSLGNDT